jgi:hypothetical protein
MDRIKQLTIALARKTAKSDFIQNLIRDLKSLRAVWNYFYLGLYAFLCIWTALRHPEHLSMAITVTGGIVSVVFTGYVFSKTYEKKNGLNGNNHIPPPGQ